MWRVVLLSCGILAFAVPAFADTYVVNPDGIGDFPTIQAAIDAVVDGDVIELSNGVFIGNGNRDIDFLGKAITVRSQSGDPDSCIIDCQGSEAEPHRAISFVSGEAGSAVLDAVTVANGHAPDGGALLCVDSSPTVSNCILRNCVAEDEGGAVYCLFSSVTLVDCTFLGNSAGRHGGGVACRSSTGTTILRCDFSGNRGGSAGGGVDFHSSEGVLTECVFRENLAMGGIYGDGGGLYCDSSSPSVRDCAFFSNYAQRNGGGLGCRFSADPALAGCTFGANIAANVGGAIVCATSSNAQLTNCTLWGNSASAGGGIMSEASLPRLDNVIIAFSTQGEAVAGGATLTCCDLYGNAGGDWEGEIEGQYGIGGNIAANPLFCDPENEDFHLREDSPCAPFSPPNEECDLIGAWPIGCEAVPTTYVVRPDGSGDFPTIQAAIDAAVNGDVIELTNGTFTGDGNRDIDFLGKAIEVRSQGGVPDSCVIDCQGTQAEPHRGFYFHCGEGPACVLEGITVSGGLVVDGGGGICCQGSSPLLRNCSLRNNWADGFGGGLFGMESSVQVLDCVFCENGAWGGGGLYFHTSPSPVVSNCVFRSNWSEGRGGGLGCLSTAATISDCIVRANCTDGWGGGIHCVYSPSPAINRCTVSDNAALMDGGGMCCDRCSPEMSECTFAGNLATRGGGMYFHDECEAVLLNTVVAFAVDGGAIRCELSSVPSLGCCDLYGNVGGDWVGPIADQEGMTGNFSADPCFCDMENDDYHLWNYSPCNQEGCGLIGAWPVGCWEPQGTEGEVAGPAWRTPVFLSAAPNPFTSSTQIVYAFPGAKANAGGSLRVYDASGRLVRILVRGRQPGSIHSAFWDGLDQCGNRLGSGIYFARLQVGEQSLIRRLTLLR